MAPNNQSSDQNKLLRSNSQSLRRKSFSGWDCTQAITIIILLFRSKTKPTLLYVVAGVLVVLLLVLVLGLYFGLKSGDLISSRTQTARMQSPCTFGTEFRNYSVSTDTSECSMIGCGVLDKGGSAVDAAIASMLCITVVTMQSSGIGGGAFMLVYEKKRRKATFIDAREVAPGAATKNMYLNNSEAARKGKVHD